MVLRLEPLKYPKTVPAPLVYGEDTPLFDNDTAEHRKSQPAVVVAIISSKIKNDHKPF